MVPLSPQFLKFAAAGSIFALSAAAHLLTLKRSRQSEPTWGDSCSWLMTSQDTPSR
jgi:hypothetical protein